MIPVRVSFRYEFITVPTCSSVFIYMIPVQNVIPAPYSVPVSCKGGMRFRSGRR